MHTWFLVNKKVPDGRVKCYETEMQRQEKMKKKNKHCVYEWLPCPSIDIWLCFLAFYNRGPILRFPLSLIPFSLSRFPSLTASHMRSWLHWSLEINKKNKHGKHTHKEMLLMGVFSMFVIWYDHDMICCWVFHWCVLHQVINLCIFAACVCACARLKLYGISQPVGGLLDLFA